MLLGLGGNISSYLTCLVWRMNTLIRKLWVSGTCSNLFGPVEQVSVRSASNITWCTCVPEHKYTHAACIYYEEFMHIDSNLTVSPLKIHRSIEWDHWIEKDEDITCMHIKKPSSEYYMWPSDLTQWTHILCSLTTVQEVRQKDVGPEGHSCRKEWLEEMLLGLIKPHN